VFQYDQLILMFHMLPVTVVKVLNIKVNYLQISTFSFLLETYLSVKKNKNTLVYQFDYDFSSMYVYYFIDNMHTYYLGIITLC